MSKITVKAGKGEITLKKSRKYVGLKANQADFVETSETIKEKVLESLGGFKVVRLNKIGNSLDESLDMVRSDEAVDVGTHIYYKENSDTPIVATGNLFIVFQPGTDASERDIVLDEFKLEVIKTLEEHRIVARVTKDSRNPLKVAQELQRSSLVKWAEPDLDSIPDAYEFTSPQDSLFDHQWHIKNSGFVIDANWRLKRSADAKIEDAWSRLGNMGSSDVTIAIVDNGFDIEHPDLKDKVVKPYDFWQSSPDLYKNDPRYTHGTPCASVALASSNGQGIVGVAPNSKFMPVSGTSLSWQGTEEMFNYCVDNGADIISCSWGTTNSEFGLNPLKEAAIAKAAREGRNGKGCIVLFAVGNDFLDFVNFYATHPDVIAVAASTSQDEHADYSNKGAEVTICGPSNGDWPITAARASWDEGIDWRSGDFKYWDDGKSRGQAYKHFGGTSSSTPLVAGICALMISANPELTAKQVKEILIKTADKIGNPNEYDSNGHSKKFGFGRVNADKAVKEALRLKDGAGIEDIPVEVEGNITKGRGIFRFNVEKQAAEGYGVQVGVFAEYGNVLIQAEKLQKTFAAPVIVSINELDDRTVYKVVLGAFPDKDDARRLLSQMKDKGMNGFLRELKDLK